MSYKSPFEILINSLGILNGSILDEDVSPVANINASKLLDGSITDSKISNTADINATKLLNTSITNAKISESAAISADKLANGVTYGVPTLAQISSWNTASGRIESSIIINLDGGGVALTTGIKADLILPFSGTITKVSLLADQAGDIVIDIWKDTYANYPPDVADTITAAAKPTLSSAAKATDSTLFGWTKTVSASECLRINIDSVATLTRCALCIDLERD